MSAVWKDNGGGDFENPEPGSYAGTCYKIVDLGTQTSEYQGKPNSRRQVILTWELDELMSDGRPFIVSKFYTASLSEKANLRHDLASWRGRDFTPEELMGFSPRKILGASCLVTLTKNDKGKVRVTGVAKLPKGMNAPTATNPQVFFHLDEFDQATFDGLSDGVKKIIVQSPEYQEIAGKRAAATGAPAGNGGSHFDDFADDIPF